MKDDLPYFSHDNDARNHAKMKALRARYGWTGYGQFWALNEMIAGAAMARLDVSRKVVRASVACELGMTTEALDDLLTFLSDDDECGLIHYENGIITTDRTQEDFERVATERARKRGNGKNSAEKRKNSAENPVFSAEPPRKNSTEESRGDKSRKEESRGDKNSSSQSPSSFFQPNDGVSRLDALRKIWNESGLPEMRRQAVTFFPNEYSECLATISVYSNDEIEEAMHNYKQVISEPEYDLPPQFQYKSFQSFIGKGVEKFSASAKPFEVYKKRTGPPGAGKKIGVTDMSDIEF